MNGPRSLFCGRTFNTKVVVPAQGGTHTPQRFDSLIRAELFTTTNVRDAGSPPARRWSWQTNLNS